MTFHVSNGICFDRLADGGVRIFRRAQVAASGTVHRSEAMLAELTASEWASVVSSVSQRGMEYPGLHDEVLECHQRSS